MRALWQKSVLKLYPRDVGRGMARRPWGQSGAGLRKLTRRGFGVQQAVSHTSVLLRTLLLTKMTKASVKGGIRRKGTNFWRKRTWKEGKVSRKDRSL